MFSGVSYAVGRAEFLRYAGVREEGVQFIATVSPPSSFAMRNQKRLPMLRIYFFCSYRSGAMDL